MDETTPKRIRTAWPHTRTVAALVLVPTVPMLAASLAAMAFFYLAPDRFGRLIARLPGESFIRTALVFAPATLFAIAVLAFLYVIEKPAPAPRRTPAARMRNARVMSPGRITAAVSSLLALPSFLIALAAWALALLSPDRFARLIEPLPGDAYLRAALPYAVLLLFAIALISAWVTLAAGVRAEQAADALPLGVARLRRASVLGVLLASLLGLAIALGGVGLFYLAPDRFERLLQRLPYDTLIRFTLYFVPAMLTAVVALASMYLIGKERTTEMRRPVRPLAKRRLSLPSSARGSLAVAVLVAGLSLSAALGLGLLGALAYLVLR